MSMSSVVCHVQGADRTVVRLFDHPAIARYQLAKNTFVGHITTESRRAHTSNPPPTEADHEKDHRFGIRVARRHDGRARPVVDAVLQRPQDRKSTRLHSSHG